MTATTGHRRNFVAPPGSDPAADSGWTESPARQGFFTDTSICIGCKACEVACKEWNALPADGMDLLGSSYDNTGALGATTWRHVAFIEQRRPAVSLGMPGFDRPASAGPAGAAAPAPDGAAASARGQAAEPLGAPVGDPVEEFRWLMSSDVCKHCTQAGCLDVCPTGSLFRSEFGTVVVQDDICNGCGYCVPACPFGVIDRRENGAATIATGPTPEISGLHPERAKDGIAQKCTLCYDRLDAGATPACAQACPTQSIQFGDVDELRERAAARLTALQGAGVGEARLYGADPADGVGGTGAMFLLLDEPEVYGLPPDPVVPTRDLPAMWRQAALAAGALLGGAALSFLGRRR